MIELLKILLSLSLAGTLLILVLLLCKPFYRNSLSRQWQYYIWLVVVARLLLPFTPETSLAGNLFREVDSSIVQISTGGPADSHSSPETDFAKHDTPPENQADMTTGESPEPEKTLLQKVPETAAQNIWLICVLVWLMVSVGLLIRKVTIYQSFVKYINAGRIEVTDMRLWERLGNLVEQTGVKTTVELYTNSLISSPLLIGFLHPCIMLPSGELSDSDLENTILHELTHYKRRDMFYKWLVQIAICFHWFNPFVYLMGKELNRACEFSCDEAVIRTFDKEAQRAYGDTLLNAIGAGGNYNDSPASVMLNENAEFLKERLGAIMIYRKKTKLTVACSLVLTITLACGATAIGAYAAPTSQLSATATLTGSKVVRAGGVYYIFCDGADENDKPISNVTEGSIMFVLVRKDGCTSIGPFDDITKLNDEVIKQCEYMLKVQSITQEETNLIMEVVSNIQLENEKQYKQVPLVDEEYSKWKIDKKEGAYYYENERVRIFMDLRENNSFVNFNYDGRGTIDIRLVRGHNGDITEIEHITQTEAEKILADFDIAHSSLIKEEEDVSRLSKDLVSEKILNTINSCDDGTWYVVVENEYQYIYYNGVPHNYAWQPEFSQDSATIQIFDIDIFDIDKSTGTYVLLKVPASLKLDVYYNAAKIQYEKVNIQ